MKTKDYSGVNGLRDTIEKRHVLKKSIHQPEQWRIRSRTRWCYPSSYRRHCFLRHRRFRFVPKVLQSRFPVNICDKKMADIAAEAKMDDRERKKREIRERLEAQLSSSKKKKGFMTPERKKRLRVGTFFLQKIFAFSNLFRYFS